uniref:Activin types I and II receptor domain-containing protein n=1 Tax=Callorhinchus milii TaxID=7868 RepID=A0A4W3GRL6_CALMI
MFQSVKNCLSDYFLPIILNLCPLVPQLGEVYLGLALGLALIPISSFFPLSLARCLSVSLLVLLSLSLTLSLSVSFPSCPALKCFCKDCVKFNQTCETDGACLASLSRINGVQHEIRLCVSAEKLVPPIYCQSNEDYVTTICCYQDFCNKLELSLKVEGWGPVELAAVIAGPVFLVCLLLMVTVFLYHYQRAYHHRNQLDIEEASCDHMFISEGKTLKDLMFDMTTSGSGSGTDGRLYHYWGLSGVWGLGGAAVLNGQLALG